jgi:tRNA-specific 2-thiouridylase
VLFDDLIIRPFVETYISGKTPNPCVVCNPQVKFRMLFDSADKMGYDYVSTGHYARICSEVPGRYSIHRGLDRQKDQSYMLYRLENEYLSRMILPLGELKKQEIRNQIDHVFGDLFVNETESQDICFLHGKTHHDLILQKSDLFLSGRKGDIIDRHGQVLGVHNGIFHYTIGQRKGLGLSGGPWFVLSLDPQENKVVVGAEKDLFPSVIHCTSPVWHGNVSIGDIYHAQHRYRTKPTRIQITDISRYSFTVKVLDLMRAPAPGQSLVLYKSDEVLGGGIINSTEE